MEILKQLFSENEKYSLTRILSAILVLVPILLWCYFSIAKFEMQAIPESVTFLILSGFGGKIADGFLKNKNGAN